MAFCLRPPPLLQEQRSLTVSSDNGTVTPLPIPYTDLWDINSIPNAGLTQIYNISNISQYQGRIIYINKTQDTTGSTIQLELPGGYVFSTVGTSTLVLPDAPSAFGLVFSSSAIISVISGLGGGGITVGPRQSSTRINIDPSSNPDPLTNGLLIPAGTGEFSMPLTVADQSLGIANPYIDDPNGDYTINSDSVLFNNDGNFFFALSVGAIGSVSKTSPFVAQVLLQGQTIFTAPPICAAALQAEANIGPFGPYDKVWFLCDTGAAQISAGDELVVRILPNNPTDDNVIQLTGNLSICRIDDKGIIGPQGPPGPAPNAYENGILQGTLSPGINFTNLDVNSSPQGVNVTQTINSTPINYQVADSNISNNTISRINDATSSAIVDATGPDIGVFTTDGSIIIEATKSGAGIGFQLIATGASASSSVSADGLLNVNAQTLGLTSTDVMTLNAGNGLNRNITGSETVVSTGDLTADYDGSVGFYAHTGLALLSADTGNAKLYGLVKASVESDTRIDIWAVTGDVRIINLSSLNSPDNFVTRDLVTGRLRYGSVPYSRKATITNLTVPIGTADGVVYGSLIFAGATPYGRVGDIIEFTYVSFAGFDNVGTETSINIGGHLIPSIGTGINQLKGTVCLTSLSGTTPTYKYSLLYNTNNLVTGTFVGPNISSGLSVYLIAASFPATTSPIIIDFAYMQLNRLNQA